MVSFNMKLKHGNQYRRKKNVLETEVDCWEKTSKMRGLEKRKTVGLIYMYMYIYKYII